MPAAGPDRETYWTCKEGGSEIPHFWYREFGLDLGPAHEEMRAISGLWKRDFANATVVVNPGLGPAEYSFEGECVNVLAEPLQSPITVKVQTGTLLVRNRRILPEN